MIVSKLYVVVSQLSDLTVTPSYDQVINHQNRSLKVGKVAGANKVGVPHPQYSALTVNDDNDVFICCHLNSTHFMSCALTTTHQYYKLDNQYIIKVTFVNDCDDNVSYITVDI